MSYELSNKYPVPGKEISIYPIHHMKVGDSFEVENSGKARSVYSLVRKIKGKEFRVSYKQLRCWRIK